MSKTIHVSQLEALLEDAKDPRHCLHQDLWSEGDQVWAQRGRLDRCRRIIGALQEVVVVDGRETQIPAFLVVD